MKLATLLITFVFVSSFAFGQTNKTKDGKYEFVELKYGLAKVVEGTSEKLKNSPTGTRGILEEFEITVVTDSIKVELKANFGVEYLVRSGLDQDIDVTIEWIYPEKIKTEEGKKIKSLKYTTTRPTNTETASSYSLDGPNEMVKGNWKMNIFIDGQLLYSRTFVLY